MPEKFIPPPDLENNSPELSLAEIKAVAESGLADNAKALAKIKLESLKQVLADINKTIEDPADGIILKQDWQNEQKFIEDQIAEIEGWLEQN